MKLFNLVRVCRGKRTLIMTGDRAHVRNRRARLLKDSAASKKGRHQYLIEPAEDGAVKYRKKPHNPRIGGGDAQTPRLTKWD